jgi:hypothetical protein
LPESATKVVFTEPAIPDIFGFPPKPKLNRLVRVYAKSTGRGFVGSPSLSFSGMRDEAENAVRSPVTAVSATAAEQ